MRYHAQQSLVSSGLAIDVARDANELAGFSRNTPRENLARVAMAKILLSARLYAETHDTHGPHPLAAQEHAQIAESFEEHSVAELALKRALRTDPSDNQFDARVKC